LRGDQVIELFDDEREELRLDHDENGNPHIYVYDRVMDERLAELEVRSYPFDAGTYIARIDDSGHEIASGTIQTSPEGDRLITTDAPDGSPGPWKVLTERDGIKDKISGYGYHHYPDEGFSTPSSNTRIEGGLSTDSSLGSYSYSSVADSASSIAWGPILFVVVVLAIVGGIMFVKTGVPPRPLGMHGSRPPAEVEDKAQTEKPSEGFPSDEPPTLIDEPIQISPPPSDRPIKLASVASHKCL
jgi:hypothetical protein